MRRRLLGATGRHVVNVKQVHDIRPVGHRQPTTRPRGFRRQTQPGLTDRASSTNIRTPNDPAGASTRGGWKPSTGTARAGGRVEADYARSYRTLWERHWWWRSREAFLLGWIRRLNRRGATRRILDVG